MTKEIHPHRIKLTHPEITRGQILFTGLLAFSASLLYFFPHFPFHPGFYVITLLSGLSHLILYLLFNRLFPMNPIFFAALSSYNIVLLGFAVHYTGGIISPFVFAFFSIIIADAAYGIEYSTGLITALLVYLVVVGTEYFGFWTPVDISPMALYSNPFSTLIVVAITLPFMFFAGQIYKIIMHNLRTTVEKEHQEKLAMIHQLAKLEAPSQIGLLVNRIVHDVRGPLGAISGFIKIIRSENKLKSESQEDCEIMIRELDRVSHLLNRMLNYVKPGGSGKAAVCPVNLMETVLSVAAFLPGARRVRFVKNFPKTEAFFVHANKEELQQVYFNVLKNSIEALENTAGAGTIHLGVRQENGYAVIEIQDSGPGFSPDIAEMLSSKEIISTKKEGAGVGLAIVKEILEAHGGSLEIDGKKGDGARVVTRLPLYHPPEEAK